MARFDLFADVNSLFADFERARTASRIYDEMSNMSDANLKSRGLTRADLPGYAIERAAHRR